MKVYRPTYVKNFHCDGKLCGSRCCRDWNVVLDETTRKKFLQLPEDDREEFFRHVTTLDDDQVLQMTDSGACPFLGDDFLCKLQLKHGEDFLSAVCQSFPRVTYKIADEVFVQAMTLTCPVAATKILLRKRPIAFEVVDTVGARMVFDFTEKISKPVDEFLRGQRAAIKILKRRELSINERLRLLCEHFGEKISVPVNFDVESNATALAEIFSETYDADLTLDKKNQLVKIYLTAREKILPYLYENLSSVLENYLVNEFFMRLYPCAFPGGERFNIRVFVTAYRLVEFSVVLSTISRGQLEMEDFMEILCSLSDKLDHSRGGMDAIRTFAEDYDAEIFYMMMIE